MKKHYDFIPTSEDDEYFLFPISNIVIDEKGDWHKYENLNDDWNKIRSKMD